MSRGPFLILSFLLLSVTPTLAIDICVDSRNISGFTDGTSAHPFQSIQTAIDTAETGTRILVAGSSYQENVVVHDVSLTLLGGYKGGTSAQYVNGSSGDFVTRDSATFVSHIQGDVTTSVVSLINAGTTTIDGFSISNGSGQADPYYILGGGIYVSGGQPVISNNLIENNDMTLSARSEVRLIGGGIGAEDANVTIRNNVIRNNTSQFGGGISVNGGQVIIEGNIVSDNSATADHGGGLYISAPQVILTDNLIFGNEVGRSLGYGWGGGIHLFSSSTEAQFLGNSFYHNYAPTAGGGVFIDDGATASIRNDLVFGNSVDEEGGAGIYVDGLDNTGSVLYLEHCTVADNGPGGWLGGNAVYASQYSQATVTNSIFWNNGDDVYADATSSVAVSYTLTDELVTGTGNLSADPLFADTLQSDYHLQSTAGRYSVNQANWITDTVTSPAIDAASSSADYSNEPAPNGQRANLGAYGNTPQASKSGNGSGCCENPIVQLPVLSISAMGGSDHYSINAGETVILSLDISSGTSAGAMADWWLVRSDPQGLQWFDLSQGSFVDGFLPTFQGELFDFNDVSVLQQINQPGQYLYVFAVDLVPNNNVSAGEEIYFDVVNLTVNSASTSTPPPDNGGSGSSVTRIYVAGESVEEMNRFINPPFNPDGTLYNLGSSNNNTFDEYGWMVPFAEALGLRDPDLSVEWVGSDCWMAWDWECSDGTYPQPGTGYTSAVSGTTITQWLSQRRSELVNQTHCYDVAFASRGGNDLMQEVSEETYRENLRELILLLDAGSSCSTHPLILVTAHMLDIAGGVEPSNLGEVTAWMNTQENYYVNIPQSLVNELKGSNPELNLQFVDLWTPFREDWQTTAFPNETWWTTVNGVNAPDLDKIHREQDYWSAQHPRRLSSIFAGENAANQVDLQLLRSVLAQ